ncbi:MAG: LysR family transcriptional regulator [Planctomycetes bacterium]|nr:LysR family transcriptional regulator [Planctomycetota bacterium]
MNRTIDWEPGDALIFAQVVDQGSFTAAARILDLPKSSVSRRVSRLEGQLGVQLLRRTTRRLDLTDAGRAFYARAAQAAEALVAAEQAVTSMLDEPLGRLRVTAPVELGTRLFEVLLGFTAAYPQVRLDLELTNRYVNLVEEGYDAALRGGRAPEGSLTGRSLGVGESVLVASPSYLAGAGAVRRVTDIAKHDCILFPSWVSGGAWSLTNGRKTTVVPVRGRLTVNNLEAIRLGALAGLGLTLLPNHHCAADLAAGTLVRVLPRWSNSNKAGLFVVYSRTRFLSAKVRALADYLVANFAFGAPA